jgi:hypothetical protein
MIGGCGAMPAKTTELLTIARLGESSRGRLPLESQAINASVIGVARRKSIRRKGSSGDYEKGFTASHSIIRRALSSKPELRRDVKALYDDA